MAKYDPWHEFFENLQGDRHRFDLDRLEAESGVRLPPSARKHQAWWSSAQYYAIWADHGWRATPRLATNEVIFTRAPSRRSNSPVAAPTHPVDTEADLILLGCVASKRPESAPAKDLYTSALWNKRRRYAEATDQPWEILSAEYGLIDPDVVIEPYDKFLESQTRDYREQWSRTAADAVITRCRELGASTVEIHAGKAYIEHGLQTQLERSGIQVLRPLEHLRRGEQLAWYNAKARGEEPHTVDTFAPVDPVTIAADPVTRAPDPSEPVVRSVISIIRNAVGDLGQLFGRSGSGNVPAAQEVREESRSQQFVVDALLRYGSELEAAGDQRPVPEFTPNEAANSFLIQDPFAFLVAVVADYQVKAERAWEAPYLLSQRLGSWGPEYVAAHPGEVKEAFNRRPSLHRFPSQTAGWVVQAAQTVLDDYGGDAAAIWNGTPGAADLQERLRSFSGISQKKAAMAVEILERNLGVSIADLHGSDIAYDVHIRRVFLRSGLAERDDVNHMVDVARRLYPERPGALDFPSWAIGRAWCRPTDPACRACPIGSECPRLIDRATGVAGA